MVADSDINRLSKNALREGDKHTNTSAVNNPALISLEALQRFWVLTPLEIEVEDKNGNKKTIVYDSDDRVIAYGSPDGKIFSDKAPPNITDVSSLDEARKAGYLLPEQIQIELEDVSPYSDIAAFNNTSTSAFMLSRQIQHLVNEKQNDIYPDGKISLQELVSDSADNEYGLLRIFAKLSHETVLNKIFGEDGKNVDLSFVKEDQSFKNLTQKSGDIEDISFDVNDPDELYVITNLVLKTIHGDNLEKPYSKDDISGKNRPTYEKRPSLERENLVKITDQYIDAISLADAREGILTNTSPILPAPAPILNGPLLIDVKNTLRHKGIHSPEFHYANKQYTDHMIGKAAQISKVIATSDTNLVAAILGIGTTDAENVKNAFAQFSSPEAVLENYGQQLDVRKAENRDVEKYWTVNHSAYINGFLHLTRNTNVAALLDGALFGLANAQGYNSKYINNHDLLNTKLSSNAENLINVLKAKKGTSGKPLTPIITAKALEDIIQGNKPAYITRDLKNIDIMNSVVLINYRKIIDKTNDITAFLKDRDPETKEPNSYILRNADAVTEKPGVELDDHMFIVSLMAMADRMSELDAKTGEIEPTAMAKRFKEETGLEYGNVYNFMARHYLTPDSIKVAQEKALADNAKWLHDYVHGLSHNDKILGVQKAENFDGDIKNVAFLRTYSATKSYLEKELETTSFPEIVKYRQSQAPGEDNGILPEVIDRLIAFERIDPGTPYEAGILQKIDCRALLLNAIGDDTYLKIPDSRVEELIPLLMLKQELNKQAESSPHISKADIKLDGINPELDANFLTQLKYVTDSTEELLTTGSSDKLAIDTFDGTSIKLDKDTIKLMGVKKSMAGLDFENTPTTDVLNVLEQIKDNILRNDYSKHKALYNHIDTLSVIYAQYLNLPENQKIKIKAQLRLNEINQSQDYNGASNDTNTRGGPNPDGYGASNNASTNNKTTRPKLIFNNKAQNNNVAAGIGYEDRIKELQGALGKKQKTGKYEDVKNDIRHHIVMVVQSQMKGKKAITIAHGGEAFRIDADTGNIFEYNKTDKKYNEINPVSNIKNAGQRGEPDLPHALILGILEQDVRDDLTLSNFKIDKSAEFTNKQIEATQKALPDTSTDIGEYIDQVHNSKNKTDLIQRLSKSKFKQSLNDDDFDKLTNVLWGMEAARRTFIRDPDYSDIIINPQDYKSYHIKTAVMDIVKYNREGVFSNTLDALEKPEAPQSAYRSTYFNPLAYSQIDKQGEVDGNLVGQPGKKLDKRAFAELVKEKFIKQAASRGIDQKNISKAMANGEFAPHPEDVKLVFELSAISAKDLTIADIEPNYRKYLVDKNLMTKVSDPAPGLTEFTDENGKTAYYGMPHENHLIRTLQDARNKAWNAEFGDLTDSDFKFKTTIDGQSLVLTGLDLAFRHHVRMNQEYFEHSYGGLIDIHKGITFDEAMKALEGRPELQEVLQAKVEGIARHQSAWSLLQVTSANKNGFFKLMETYDGLHRKFVHKIMNERPLSEDEMPVASTKDKLEEIKQVALENTGKAEKDLATALTPNQPKNNNSLKNLT